MTADHPPTLWIVATRQGDAAGQQHAQLQHLGPDHRPQPAGDRVDAGRHGQDHDAPYHGDAEESVKRQARRGTSTALISTKT